MPQDFSSLLGPETFTVLSQDGRSFLVHGSILAAQSAPLRSLISGDWRETTERTISLEDWDGDTVGRFVEFLYTGNYQYPPFSRIFQRILGSDKEEESGNTSLGAGIEDKGKDKDQDRPLTPLDQCLDPSLRRAKKKGTEDERWISQLKASCDPDCSEVLLAHAKVYALAHYKDVMELKALSLERLMNTLLNVGDCSYNQAAAGIAELLGYVYAHTDSPNESEEPMRRIVSQFAALKITKLRANKEMKELMSKGGDFVNDLMWKVCRRLIALEEYEGKQEEEEEEEEERAFRLLVALGED